MSVDYIPYAGYDEDDYYDYYEYDDYYDEHEFGEIDGDWDEDHGEVYFFSGLNKERKLELWKQRDIHCPLCRYHKHENASKRHRQDKYKSERKGR